MVEERGNRVSAMHNERVKLVKVHHGALLCVLICVLCLPVCLPACLPACLPSFRLSSLVSLSLCLHLPLSAYLTYHQFFLSYLLLLSSFIHFTLCHIHC